MSVLFFPQEFAQIASSFSHFAEVTQLQESLKPKEKTRRHGTEGGEQREREKNLTQQQTETKRNRMTLKKSGKTT